jgi:polyisoprenoid-binding protein YceI
MFIHQTATKKQNYRMIKIWIPAFLAIFSIACTNPGANTEVSEAQEVAEATEASETYIVNSSESVLNWRGSKLTGDDHIGSLSIANGELNVDNGVIQSGSFVIDMNSIEVMDEGMEESQKAKLRGKLMNEEFFLVDSFPTAVFEVSGSTQDSLTGNLTIKGITNSITIPYFFQADEGIATATSSFSINRALWDIKYRSSTFFDGLGDKVISDAIEFEVKLVANN